MFFVVSLEGKVVGNKIIHGLLSLSWVASHQLNPRGTPSSPPHFPTPSAGPAPRFLSPGPAQRLRWSHRCPHGGEAVPLAGFTPAAAPLCVRPGRSFMFINKAA